MGLDIDRFIIYVLCSCSAIMIYDYTLSAETRVRLFDKIDI